MDKFKPFSETALVQCLEVFNYLCQKESEENITSQATSIMANELPFFNDHRNFESYDDSGELRTDWWKIQGETISQCLSTKFAKEWVKMRIEEYPEGSSELENIYGIGKSEFFKCSYLDKESFLKEVDYEKIVDIATKSIYLACHEEEGKPFIDEMQNMGVPNLEEPDQNLSDVSSAPIKENDSIKKQSKPKSKFYISDDLFYRISLIGFLLIFGSMIFFIVEYRDKESNKVSALLKTEQINKTKNNNL